MRMGRTRLSVAFVLGLSALSLSAEAQQPTRIPRVGILSDEMRSLPESFEPFAKGYAISATSKAGTLPSSGGAQSTKTTSFQASPPNWLAFSRTSSSLSARWRRAPPRAQPRRSQSSLPESLIRLPLVSSRVSPGPAATSPA